METSGGLMLRTRITDLLGIRWPVIQGGMVWVSGWKLASAVSAAGGLGLIGAGSMKPELLREHLGKARSGCSAPVGVNVPLLREDAADLIVASLEEGARILVTSAGHPGRHIDAMLRAGCTVLHVVSSVKQARKAEAAGCHAVVAEGVEAGGHNGADETTTFALVPQVADAVSIPVVAAGGIADGRGMLAALSLGAEGVQIGTRFAATAESSAHETFKRLILEADDASTVLAFRALALTRLIRTPFAARAVEAESGGAGRDDLAALLGAKRERRGMFEGDLGEGAFEAGQVAGLIRDIPGAAAVMQSLIDGYRAAVARMAAMGE